MKGLVFVAAVLSSAAVSRSALVKPPGTFELLILHNNDMHARFEQTSQLGGACSPDDRELGKCYGGFPRVAYVVKEARRAAQTGEGPPVLYLNAGDTYTGTSWFKIYKWKIAADFINALQPDAVSLGSNDIDRKTRGLSPFAEEIHTKILASNVIIKTLKGNSNVQKSVIFDINGMRVGIVGYVTPTEDVLDASGDIEYIDEVIAVREEVKILQSSGVNIIIALGHSTHEKDLEIARSVDGIDLVIAGQKNKFYWDGRAVSDLVETTVVRQKSGKTVPVIPSISYNQHLGKILAEFNEEGEIAQWDDNPISLAEVPQDDEALAILKSHHLEIVSKSNEVLGDTAVVLDGSSCKTEECNLGNLVTDSISLYYAVRHQGDRWTDAAITIIHGGAFAGSIATGNRPAPVTTNDLRTALPLQSNIVAVNMSGTILNQVLEHSVSYYDAENPSGQLLQVSGVRATFDMSKQPGSRLVEAVVRCWSCYVPEYFIIDNQRWYKVLMPAALADGALGYSMLDGLQREDLEYDEVTCAAEYIKRRSPVYPEVAERVVLTNVEGVKDVTPAPSPPPTPDAASDLTANVLIIVVMAILLNFRLF